MFMHLQDTVHDYFLVHLGKILQYRVYVEFITKLSIQMNVQMHV